MPALVLGWGIAESAATGCTSFGSLLATRFLLGLFEAGCMPLFAIMTSRWYRRAEKPIRIAWWSSMNGTASMAASLLSYGLGHVHSDLLCSWQM
jgi:MFS family permease